jgi:hypothetical protein
MCNETDYSELLIRYDISRGYIRESDYDTIEYYIMNAARTTGNIDLKQIEGI